MAENFPVAEFKDIHTKKCHTGDSGRQRTNTVRTASWGGVAAGTVGSSPE